MILIVEYSWEYFDAHITVSIHAKCSAEWLSMREKDLCSTSPIPHSLNSWQCSMRSNFWQYPFMKVLKDRYVSNNLQLNLFLCSSKKFLHENLYMRSKFNNSHLWKCSKTNMFLIISNWIYFCVLKKYLH